MTDRSRALRALGLSAGVGSLLGSGVIIALSSTLPLWHRGLALAATQVGVLSATLTVCFALGTFLGGFVQRAVGLFRMFGLVHIATAAGLAACALAGSFAVLLPGIALAALAAGMDLPVALAVLSADAPDAADKTRMVSATQIFWSCGILGTYAVAFGVSGLGPSGARVVFGALAVVAALAAAWRLADPRLAALHRAGARRLAGEGNGAFPGTSAPAGGSGATLRGVLASRGASGFPLAVPFALIAVFYMLWNVLANSIGQFQTYLMVAQHASQTLAVASGIIASVTSLCGSVCYARIAARSAGDRAYPVAAAFQVAAMAVLAVGGMPVATVVAVCLFNFASAFAGEAAAKVWTQRTFPVGVAAQVQSLVLGIGRVPAAVVSLVLPSLLTPALMRPTMWAACAVAVLTVAAGGSFLAVCRLRSGA